METNTWQKCPICDGTGIKPHIDTKSLGMLPAEALSIFYKKGLDKCTVCKGKMIISRETGLPPKVNIDL